MISKEIKKVIAAYNFPPARLSCVHQVDTIARHLQEQPIFNHQLIVRNGSLCFRDNSESSDRHGLTQIVIPFEINWSHEGTFTEPDKFLPRPSLHPRYQSTSDVVDEPLLEMLKDRTLKTIFSLKMIEAKVVKLPRPITRINLRDFVDIPVDGDGQLICFRDEINRLALRQLFIH